MAKPTLQRGKTGCHYTWDLHFEHSVYPLFLACDAVDAEVERLMNGIETVIARNTNVTGECLGARIANYVEENLRGTVYIKRWR